jgi:hypothetical protein
MFCDTEFSMMGLISVILLIGLVKKNAIIMFAFALGRAHQASCVATADLRGMPAAISPDDDHPRGRCSAPCRSPSVSATPEPAPDPGS